MDEDNDLPSDSESIGAFEEIAESELIGNDADSGESAEHLAARAAQKQRLSQIKSTLAQQEGASQDASANRMNYLMRQSEVFSHFLTSGGDSSMDLTKLGAGSNSSDSGSGGRQKKGRMREDEEDRLMLKNAQSKQTAVRLLKQPSSLTGTMRPYQLEGLNWMIKLYDNNINGILADEMGLGKTLQSISLLAYLREARGVTGPHMVVVPKSVCSNWMREFARWCPSIRTVKLQGGKDERAEVVRTQLIAGQFDVVVVSFESLLKEYGALLRFKWKYCIIDEAHRIKNENSSLSKMVRRVRTDFRLLITGTPLQNNLHELWALLNFLLPEVFDEADKFDQWFNTEDEEARNNVVKRLHTVLQPFLLRRVKADVDKDIPPKTETKLYIGMTALQRDWYAKIVTKDVASLNVMTQGHVDKGRLMNMLMQLRKCTNHPYLFQGAEPGPPYTDGPHLWESSGKMVLLDKLLRKLKAQNSRVLIFSQMTRMLDILEDYMVIKSRDGEDYQDCRIDGNTSGEKRDEQMDVFNKENSEKFVFLLSTRAGGLGINLQTADIVILFDSDWNPQADLQAMDRAHRIGQKKPVRVFRFITEKTVEEKIIERADKKLFLDAAVIQQGRLAANAQLSSNELMSMCRFGADEIINRGGDNTNLTDEDIDALLAKGEERTKAMAGKISEHMQHNLANFSTSLDKGEESMDLLSFGGFNDGGAKGEAEQPAFIALPTRERKRNYAVDDYFRNAMYNGDRDSDEEEEEEDGTYTYTGGGVQAANKSIPGTQRVRRYKRVTYPPYQFYDKRIHVIQDLEERLFENFQNQRVLLRKLHTFTPDAKKTFVPKEVLDDMVDGRTEDGLPIVCGHTINDIPRLEAELKPAEGEFNKFELSEELQRERREIEARAFNDWSRSDLKTFLRGVEMYGCIADPKLKERAVNFIVEIGEKDRAEVSRYYDTFSHRYQELDLGARCDTQISRGNKKAQKAGLVEKTLRIKMENIGGKVMYVGGTKGKFFSEENDTAILHFMYEHGYGNWEKIQKALRECKLFEFDFFIRSRSLDEIHRRCEQVHRFVEKEISKWEGKCAKAAKDLATAESLLAVASKEEVAKGDSEKLQTSVNNARASLASLVEKQEHPGMESVIPMLSDAGFQSKMAFWQEAEAERIKQKLKSSELVGSVVLAAVAAELAEVTAQRLAEEETAAAAAAAEEEAEERKKNAVKAAVEPYTGPITACSAAKAKDAKSFSRALTGSIPNFHHTNLSIESAMRHIKRVGSSAATGGVGVGFGANTNANTRKRKANADAIETAQAAGPEVRQFARASLSNLDSMDADADADAGQGMHMALGVGSEAPPHALIAWGVDAGTGVAFEAPAAQAAAAAVAVEPEAAPLEVLPMAVEL